MAQFLTELKAHLLDDDKIWELDEALSYKSDYIFIPITVPKGFQTDFASVPRIPIIYMLYGNRAHRESIIHDYLYRKDSMPPVSESLANEIFYEAMKLRGKSWYVRYPMYYGVCIGGFTRYHKKNVEDKL